MDKIISDVYLTNEYEQFKKIPGNRKVRANMKLEKSILKKGILTPIAVNSIMEIIDGQHRFNIAKKYQLPLPYYVTISKNMDDIIELNNTSHNWSIQDYINKYVSDGIESYIKLNDLLSRYKKIPIGDIISAAQGSLVKSCKENDKLKDGRFTILNEIEFEPVLNKFNDFIYKTGINPVSGSFTAFFNIINIKKFDLNSFIEKVNDQDLKTKIIGIRKSEQLLKRFVETYNFGLIPGSCNYIEYRMEKNRTIAIKEEYIKNLISPDYLIDIINEKQ
ncbi:hypothetical protein IGJ02_003035 [Enterococcus sp. DIV0724b]|uniref:ParB N-terminal domain-containing protein n=1 Tax=Enterococcus sp. DIV0724b TaxID=2774694 RepID=UPI003D2FB672